MRILYHLQLSAVDRQTKKFLMDKDSNFNFFISMVKAFNECTPVLKEKYKWICLLPEEDDMEYDELEMVNNVTYTNVRYCKDVFSSRYFWDPEEMKSEILARKPDIIWENNPTLVNNWKTLLLETGLIDKVKVVSYFHWISNKKYPKIDERCSYLYRQVESIFLSDLTLCNSNFAKQQLRDSIMDIHSHNWFENEIMNKIQPIPPMIDDVEIRKYQCEKNKNALQIIYPHRLSSMNYYKDAFDDFLKILNVLKKSTKKNIVAVLTDASGKMKSRKDIPFKDSKNVKLILKKNLSREDYYKELNKSHICIATFRKGNGGGWCMSAHEALVANCAIILPNHAGYKEMVPFNFAFDNEKIISTLTNFIKIPQNMLKNALLCNEFYENKYSNTIISVSLDNLLHNILRRVNMPFKTRV